MLAIEDVTNDGEIANSSINDPILVILPKQRLEAINFKKFCESSLNSKYIITAKCKLPSHTLSPNQDCVVNLALNDFDQSKILPFFFCHQIMKCVQFLLLPLAA